MRSRIIGTLAAVAALLGGSALLPAYAVQAPAPRYSATALGASDLGESSVYHFQINDQVEADLMKTPANSVWSSSLNNSIVSEEKLYGPTREKLSWGSLANGPVDIPETVIAKIGGPFADNATLLGSVDLPAGTWMVNTSVVFSRTISGATGTRPQLALWYSGGQNAGTLMGIEISPTANRELTESAVETIVVTEPTQMSVYGFGYNDDQSAAGGGQITAKAKVTLLRVGVPSVG